MKIGLSIGRIPGGVSKVASNGHSSGLLSIWRKECFVAESAFSGAGFLCVEGRWNGSSSLISIINVYAPQGDSNKRILLLDLCSFLATSSNLFCVMGDFNSVRKPDERMGFIFDHRRVGDFNAFISATNLQEPHMGGRRFTWVGQGGLKLSKLDRFLVSRELLELWLDLAVVAL